MLMLEWNLESVPLNEVGEGVSNNTIMGGLLGTQAGAVAGGGVWAVKRLQLMKKKKSCQGDPDCEAIVDAEIKSLRDRALLAVPTAMLAGGAAGAAIGRGYQGQAGKGGRSFGIPPKPEFPGYGEHGGD